MKNVELKERFIDERNGIEYIRKGITISQI